MMTQILNNDDFAALGAPKLVYVRPVRASDVLAGAPQEAIEAAFGESPPAPEQTLYALHGANGARLAVMTERSAAYAAAFANALAPVSVH